MGLVAIYTLSACQHQHSHHTHEHDHAHPHAHKSEEVHKHTNSDEIVISIDKAKEIGIAVEVVTPRTFREVIQTGGHIIEAQGEEVTIVAKTAGIVKFNNRITIGTPFTKGGAVMTISASKLQDGDALEHARIAYDKTKSEYERAIPLVEKQIITKTDFEQLRANYEAARINFEALSSGHTAQGTTIESPINGYIKNLLVKEGDYVNTGQALATVAKNQRLQLQANVSERYYQLLRNIRDAHFKTPYDNEVYCLEDLNGRLLSYGKSTSSDNFHIPVIFEFNNGGNIIPGSFVEVFLLGKERENVISLPLSALTEEQGVYFIYTKLDDECYSKQEVKIGANDGERVEIISGVKAGDCVVTKGAIHVKLASVSNSIPGHSHSH